MPALTTQLSGLLPSFIDGILLKAHNKAYSLQWNASYEAHVSNESRVVTEQCFEIIVETDKIIFDGDGDEANENIVALVEVKPKTIDRNPAENVIMLTISELNENNAVCDLLFETVVAVETDIDNSLGVKEKADWLNDFEEWYREFISSP